jgi:hypothetical protein
MKKYFEKFKEWIIIWLWILTTLSIWVFAYQFTNYENIEDVEVWQTLTKDTFNQLLTNVRSLKDKDDELEWKINTLSWAMSTKWAKWSDITGTIGQIWIETGTDLTTLKTAQISLNKWTYLVYFMNRGISTNNAWFLEYYAESEAPSNIESSVTDRTILSSKSTMPNYTEVPFILKVKVNGTIVRFAVLGRNWATITHTGNTTFYYIQISD